MFVESSGTSKNETLLKVQKRDRKGVQIPTMQKVVRHDDLDIKLHLFQRPHREDILGLIRSLIPKFVRRVAQRTFQKRDDFECQIVPFGSYGLGAHTAGADMDLIFLGAWPVERRDFRYLFTSMLRAQPGVTDVDASSLTIKLCACVPCVSDDLFLPYRQLCGRRCPSSNATFMAYRQVSREKGSRILAADDDSCLGGHFIRTAASEQHPIKSQPFG